MNWFRDMLLPPVRAPEAQTVGQANRMLWIVYKNYRSVLLAGRLFFIVSLISIAVNAGLILRLLGVTF